MKHKIIFLLIAVLMTACTAVRYRSPRLADEARLHREIAVLPFEMVLTGNLPEGLTLEDVAVIEEHESLAFQAAMYDALLDRSDVRRKHPIAIHIQPVERTNFLLADNGISIRESWMMPTGELAELLGVDAVIRTRVSKARYLSNAASFGIDVGLNVLYEAIDGEFGWLFPWELTKTHDIFADASLFDGGDGELLWKVAMRRETDWHRPANDVIVGITRGLARRFPYRA